ncbi:MAG: SIR2 family protein [Bacteroidota bacterium]
MSFDSSQPNFRELLSLVEREPNIMVPFIGAGLSQYGYPSERLPSWNKLVVEVFEYAVKSKYILDEKAKLIVEECIGNNELIKALDILSSEMKESLFIDCIEKLLSTNSKAIPPAILELACISWSLIVTTNLDRFIEKAWAQNQGNPIVVLTNRDTDELSRIIVGPKKTNDQSVLAKIHGSIERYDSWILTTHQYNWLLNNNEAYVQLLKVLFLRTVLFLGYGLYDDDFDLIFQQLRHIFPKGLGRSFALVPLNRVDNKLREKAKQYGLKLIFYNVDSTKKDLPDGGHGEVLDFLRIVVSKWKAKGKGNSSQRRLLYFPLLDSGFVGRSTELEILSNSFLDEKSGVQIVGFGGEGKTSFIQYYVEKNWDFLENSGYEMVFGFCFYKHDVGRFVNDLCKFLNITSLNDSLESKVFSALEVLKEKKMIVILDGLEVVQDELGKFNNRLIEKFVETVLSTNCFLIITSRLLLDSFDLETIFLGPLSEKDTNEFLSNWNVKSSDQRLKKWIAREGGRHALSLRIIASFLARDKKKALNAIENLSLEDIPDESNPLLANKSLRLLHYYDESLDSVQVTFLKCFSLFKRSVSLGLILECFPKAYSKSEVNFLLKGIDLRPIIKELIDTRLIIIESGAYLTAHPNVKDFYSRKTLDENCKQFHQEVANFLLQYLPEKLPESYDEVLQYSEICFHAAKAEMWSLFHDIFYRKINRGYLNFLGNNLGAWEDFLELGSLVFPDSNWKNEPIIFPEYYRATISRCNKHLGRSKLAAREYIRTLEICSKNRSSETAKYANNFLTLTMLMGRFDLTDILIEINLGTLHWIETDWKYLWQVEHGFFPIGNYAALRGDIEIAQEYISYALKAWDNYPKERKWIFDFDRVYSSDIIIAENIGKRREAEILAYENLSLGKRNNWQETIARSRRCLASIYCLDFYLSGDKTKLHMAKEHLDKSLIICNNLHAPAMHLEVWLEIVKYELLILIKLEKRVLMKSVHLRLKQVETTIQRTGLYKFLPDLKAGYAIWFYLNKQFGLAFEHFQESLSICINKNLLLPIVSPLSLLFLLFDIDGFEKPEIAFPTSLLPKPENQITKRLNQLEVNKKVSLLSNML